MITYDLFKTGEENQVHELVIKVFDQFVGFEYSEEGQNTFKSYVMPDQILKRVLTGKDLMLVARKESCIIEVIAIRDGNHISLLFVDPSYHGQGIAKTLFQSALKILLVKQKGITMLSVNSSPYAVPIYQKLGFHKTGGEQEQNGIRFVPMEMEFTFK